MLTKNQTQNILFLLLIIGVIIGLGFLIKWAVNKNKFEIPEIYNSSQLIPIVAPDKIIVNYIKVSSPPPPLMVKGATGINISAAGINSGQNLNNNATTITLFDTDSVIYTGTIKIVGKKLTINWNPENTSKQGIYGGIQGEISMSSKNGQYQLANSKNGSCLLSSNGGKTWEAMGGLGRSITFRQSTMSVDGKYQAVTFLTGGGIFMSTDYGKTIRTTGMFGLPRGAAYTCLKMSGTGQYLLAGMYNAQVLYVSSDYGTTWRRSTTFPPGMAPVSIEMTANGEFQGIITGYPKQYVLSSDYGATWAVQSYPGGTSMIKFCRTGKYQYRVSDSNVLSHTSDYGTTWRDSKGYDPAYKCKFLMVDYSGQMAFAISETNVIYASNTLEYHL